jgi:hypothetical protein
MLVVEKFPSSQRKLGRKISKHRRPYYPVTTNEIAPPRSIDGNPTFDLEQCSGQVVKAFASCANGLGIKSSRIF